MSYTEADAELWDSDPYEYVRVKFDIFEDFVSPVSAAQTLLHSVCKKRKDVLPKTMGMLMGIVQDGANTTPSQKGRLDQLLYLFLIRDIIKISTKTITTNTHYIFL